MKTSLPKELCGFVIALTLIAPGIAAAQALPSIFEPGGPDFVPNEVLVQFKSDVTDAQIGEAFRRGGLSFIRQVRTPAMVQARELGITRASTRLHPEQAIRALSNLPGVEFAQPNWIYRNQAIPNDPFYAGGMLPNMCSDDLPSPIGPLGTTSPFGSQAEKAWGMGFTGSPDVFVAVVDASGIELNHPDLAENIWSNPAEIAGNSIDEDGNGYVDDLNGWNAYADNGEAYETGNAHGTHVAGIVGAVGNNGVGVVGVNWRVGLIAAKFGTGNGGSTADAVQAIDYVTSLRTSKGLNVVAINASWGMYPGAALDQALLASVSRAAAANILFLAAAMNNNTNTDLKPVWPAGFDTTAAVGYDSVISVGSIDTNGFKAATSNFGQNSVDLSAPGVSIQSTKLAGTYGPMSGTSMATPHVAGAIALYAATHPGATAAQIRADLFSYGLIPTATLIGLNATGSRLDIASFVMAPARNLTSPVEPADFQAAAVSGGEVTLTWIDQSDSELGFAIERSSDGQSYTITDTVGANRTAYSDRTVRPGNFYYYRLRAYNPGGSSAYITAAPVSTPQVALPAAPASLTATARNAKQGGGISLKWLDRSTNEDGFQVERKTGANGVWQILALVPANTPQFVDQAVVARTLYYYRVRAYNSAGTSAYSNEVSATAK
ncbi:MAG TPA: S8 family serine peptidase [Verrucomicrobiae bacterium]|nr:S8 family serine peptidase [Verrucomicrobiae bacterium]